MIEIYLAGTMLSFGFSLALSMISKNKLGYAVNLCFVLCMSVLSWASFGFLLGALLLDIYDK